MLIFDRFESMDRAEEFAAHVKRETGYDATAYDERRDDIDPFPFDLTAPVVYVERDFGPVEKKIITTVVEFDGAFAGT